MQRFNIRVYGLLINDNKQLLLSDEWIRGEYFTKFPGGGLEFGEGTRDCVKREFIEELNLKVEVLDHVYTTDFYQESAFKPGDQIISIYYFVKPIEPINVRLSNLKFDFDKDQLVKIENNMEVETFRFVDWDKLTEDSVTLPIDKVVVKMLKAKL